ncbi:MAG: hypothetical protein CENE_02768 [Candidatus Celerinatantimonas neptuna]|nr:MAG: hypothetical protein CENE_02768 [Candidatus Celerinatantimonas neptuna]
MKISVAHAAGCIGQWLELDVDEPISVAEAIEQSSLPELFPELDLNRCKVGIFGKICSPNQAVKPGDRVEIYRPLEKILNNEDDDDDDE